ncbi:DUF551 domain-containing protein [Alcanivorax sp. DP30]|uniref:DUF551 domain-containing protein n=1 Tax=Alcanivorax sp. DP30 TaxID=2606217 RepID=UPI00136A7E3F|nr:DUF551 domain-containing protein [Alcanivorax sp. DP30]
MSEWIGAEERPLEGERAMVATKSGAVLIACFLDNSASQFPWTGWRFEGMHPANDKITHWMPLPEPPRKEGE